MPIAPWRRRPAVPAPPCGGAAEGITAALVWMRAARVLPGWSRNAAEPAAGTNPAAASADIDENGLVCVGGLGRFMCCCSRRHRSTSGLLSCTNRIHRVLHVQGGADDLTRLLIAALTASAHANRAVAAKAAAVLAMRWQQPELLVVVSGCSGHVERNRPRADAAGFCTWPAVPAVRCSGSRSGANDAAEGIAAALVWMRAARTKRS